MKYSTGSRKRKHLTDGFLLIDKPTGPTSHDIVNIVRRRLQIRRVGHGGTLDPFATGLLLVLVNRATRLLNYLGVLKKEYEGTVRLGRTTSTDDPTGDVLRETEDWRGLGLEDVRREMRCLVGDQLQVPPAYSAKKIRGKPAHRRVRRGEEVELPPNKVTIFEFEPVVFTGSDVKFTAAVGTGTYIRSLARDLGDRLGCGAHLADLRRTSIGKFDVQGASDADTVTWEDVRAPGELVSHLERVVISEEEHLALCDGKKIAWRGAAGVADAALFRSEELVAVGEVCDDGSLQPRVVLN